MRLRWCRICAALAVLTMLCLAVGLFLDGCANKKTVPTLPGVHPAWWTDQTSRDFHGTVAIAGGTASCAKCHGADWKGGKTGVSCLTCHSAQVDECTRCHGGKDNNTGAPPYGLRGDSSRAAVTVGAHTPHLAGSALSAAVACDNCHVVPGFVLDPGHLGVDSIAEITWGPLAGSQGRWNRTTATCTMTYCHGNFVGGDTANAPQWTLLDQAPCGSCHDTGSVPANLQWKHEFHIAAAGLKCVDCHANVVDSLGAIVDANLHVNGVADTLTRDTLLCHGCHAEGAASCTHCHGGNDNQTGAPPRGLRGETLTSQLAVGAHTAHVQAGDLTSAFTCSVCHIMPTSVASPGHYGVDSVAEVIFGGVAGPQSTWSHATAICANTYCHGNFAGGDKANAPVWTAVNQAHCGSCHDIGYDPITLGGRHEKHVLEEAIPCSRCHAATVDDQLNIVGKTVHVNGHFDVVFAGQGSFSNGSCSNIGCHGGEHWY